MTSAPTDLGRRTGIGDDIVARLGGGDDTFDATVIGMFEVKGGDGDDVLRAVACRQEPGYGHSADDGLQRTT